MEPQNIFSPIIKRRAAAKLGSWLMEYEIDQNEATLLATEIINRVLAERIKSTSGEVASVYFNDAIKVETLVSRGMIIADTLNQEKNLATLLDELLKKEPKEDKEYQQLVLGHYQRNGVYAYLCPIEIDGNKIVRGDFYNGEPLDEGNNKERYYRKKYSKVFFNLGQFADGLYEYKESGGERRVNVGYLKIEDGQIIDEWSDDKEMIESLYPLPELPELEGSYSQVNWAESIRAKAIREGYPIEKVRLILNAKIWIDSRDNLPSILSGEIPDLSSLPELEGSPKQIAWANDIREKAVAEGFPLEKAWQIIEAKTWIDNRNNLDKLSYKIENLLPGKFNLNEREALYIIHALESPLAEHYDFFGALNSYQDSQEDLSNEEFGILIAKLTCLAGSSIEELQQRIQNFYMDGGVEENVTKRLRYQRII